MNDKQLPTLQPGDSHMESLIEAAIQGHASTRDALRWLVRQLVPATPPAEVTDERDAFETWWESKQRETFPKEYSHDRLAGWGAAFKPYAWRAWQARAILALRPVQVPMTDGVRERALDLTDPGMTLRDYFAARALPAIMAPNPATGAYPQVDDFHACASLAYQMADAMLKARTE